MPREGAIIFRDLVGKLEVLNVECDKCGHSGRYHLHRLIERYGIDAKLFGWSDEITADCPRKRARNSNVEQAAFGRSLHSSMPMPLSNSMFSAALSSVLRALRWRLLAHLYCR